MKKIISLIMATLLLAFVFSCRQKQNETVDRKEWWREARFGMFIHWGLYSIPAGEWKGSKGHAEWIRNTAQIPLSEYEKLVNQFNPAKFNAEDWVKSAKEAGMKYIVITTKHHDGFCLFDSKQTDFDIMSTHFKRDIMKEMAEACAKNGIKMCWYYSIMDWHHPDYLPRRYWEKNRRTKYTDFDRYCLYMKNQLKELLTNYGKIGILWFDGEWEKTWNHERGKDLYNYVQKLQPDIIINNRVDVGRAGMMGMTKDTISAGDYGTPEQEIPATGIPGVDWESCMTMNDHWGYNEEDKNFKSPEELIHNLVDIASKGGNFLLNIGPTSEGLFPRESIERLKEIGSWMKINGEAIYGTKASPFRKLSWGRCTQKFDGKNTKLFLHIFELPKDGKLIISGLENNIKKIYAQADENRNSLSSEKKDAEVIIDISNMKKIPYATIVVMEIEGIPVVNESPVIESENNIFTDKITAKISTNISNTEIRYTIDGSEPIINSTLAKDSVTIQQQKSFELKARCFRNGKPISGTTVQKFEFVNPSYALYEKNVIQGIKYQYYQGKCKNLSEFSNLKFLKKGITAKIDISLKKQSVNYGFLFEGLLKVPVDGVYKLFLESDDGSKLIIDDKVEITNDGLHPMIEKSIEIALVSGFHKIKIFYFQQEGGDGLNVSWKGPGISKEIITSKYLFY